MLTLSDFDSVSLNNQSFSDTYSNSLTINCNQSNGLDIPQLNKYDNEESQATACDGTIIRDSDWIKDERWLMDQTPNALIGSTAVFKYNNWIRFENFKRDRGVDLLSSKPVQIRSSNARKPSQFRNSVANCEGLFGGSNGNLHIFIFI